MNIPDPETPIAPIITSVGYTLGVNKQPIMGHKTRSSLISTTVFASESLPDELHKDRYSITMSFLLPTGSYATMLIKQFIAKALSE